MDLIESIKEVSLKNQKTVSQIGLKLSEEVGECSQAVLSYMKANGCEYKNLDADDIKEECIDVILVALSLYFKLGGDIDTIKALPKKIEYNSTDEIDSICLELSKKSGFCSQSILYYVRTHSEYDDIQKDCLNITLATLKLFYKVESSTDVLKEITAKKLNKWIQKANLK